MLYHVWFNSSYFIFILSSTEKYVWTTATPKLTNIVLNELKASIDVLCNQINTLQCGACVIMGVNIYPENVDGIHNLWYSCTETQCIAVQNIFNFIPVYSVVFSPSLVIIIFN